MTFGLRPRYLFILPLTALSISATAAETFPLKIGDLLQSDPARKLVDPAVKLYWGDEADLGTLAPEEACRQAVLKTLGALVQDARKRDFDSIIWIRSHLNEQFSPVVTDIECQLGKKTASVTLRASLANRK